MVAGGKCVLDACRRVRVSRATFYRWRDSRPDVAVMYQQACRSRLVAVERELQEVKEHMAGIRATVPDERPRGGLTCKAYLRAVTDYCVPVEVLPGLEMRVSRRAYRRQRCKMWQELRWLRAWLDELRLERARLLGRLNRCPAGWCQ